MSWRSIGVVTVVLLSGFLVAVGLSSDSLSPESLLRALIRLATALLRLGS